ncbi:NAD(P)/FAD-dependent oxidoreductase [Nocardia asteroides]|uniref:NAD(P)/FAD-dependent oxidoreductase n=1 Tax=Nocardia asteroides TaxID=1824 RepID=UPI001E642828|nr:FAD-dependent oxidoreductase [Nocardia asteroides]UGT64572.1 FAD-dependent oxidoreductase [Nocardia asteroides]
MTAPIVIVGAGLAGLRTAEELRRAGYEGGLVLVGDEDRPPYDRPPLSKQFVRGEVEDTALRPPEFFAEKQIELRLGVAAAGVDIAHRRLLLADGGELEYAHLVIATGLRPRRLTGLPELAGIHVLRSHSDAVALRAAVGSARSALVIGAGFIGCEVAASFRAEGLDVVLVEPQAAPLAGVLGEQVGERVAEMHRAKGVDVRCGLGVSLLHADENGAVRGAELSDGSEVAADLVVFGVGSRPEVEWLAESGVELAPAGAGGGVLADENGRTSAAGVWAAGDVAAWRTAAGAHRRMEHWTSAGEQARVVALHILAELVPGTEVPAVPAQVPYFWSDQYELKLQALGKPSPADDLHVEPGNGHAFIAYYSRDGILTAVVGAGMAGKVMKARGKIAAGARVADVLAPA